MDTYNSLAADLSKRADQLKNRNPHWLGIAGAPGSGKSTLAAELSKRLGDLLTVIPMDGYHYYRRQLDEMDNPQRAHARRGAPFTFDVARFIADLTRARQHGEGMFPGFDHGVGDPIEDMIPLVKGQSSIIVVEGNYLLLDDDPWCQLREHIFDETWFLNVPVEECNRRVCLRHQATGRTEAEARWRVQNNDGPNAELVTLASLKNADRTIQLNDSQPAQ